MNSFKRPRIDHNALYTLEQAAEFLRQQEPELTIEEARQQITEAVESGELPIAGRLAPP